MIIDALESAIDSGATLRVRYFGGSSPGGERDLQPIAVKDGKLRARCLSSGETKTFVIEKMELVVEGVASQLASSMPVPVLTYQSVDEFVANQEPSLKALGWVIQREGNTVSLHRTFKNGKLIKTPDVALTYEATTYDLVFDGEQVTEANHRERSRPWVVREVAQTTKTFGDFGKAQITFLEFAKSLSPLGTNRNA